MMRGNNPRLGPIPVKEGEIQEVTIEGIGQKGDGIARINGYVVVVPNVQKGDRVKIKIKAVRGKVSFGEVIEKTGEATEKDEDSMEDDSEAKEGAEKDSDEDDAEDKEEDSDSNDDDDGNFEVDEEGLEKE